MDRRKQVGEAGRVGLQLLELLGRALGDDGQFAAGDRPAEEGREAPIALPRLADPAPGVEILDPQDDPLGVGLLEQLDAALLPLPEVAHPGDDPPAADLPDVVDAIDVLVGGPAVGVEQIDDRPVQERGLADARRADQQDRGLAVAAQELAQLLAVGLAGHARRELLVDGLAREVEAELAQQAGPGPAPARADPSHLRAVALGQQRQQRERLGPKRDDLEGLVALPAERVELLAAELALGPKLAEHGVGELLDGLAAVAKREPLAGPQRVVGDLERAIRADRARLDDQRDLAGEPDPALGVADREIEVDVLQPAPADQLQARELGGHGLAHALAAVGDEAIAELARGPAAGEQLGLAEADGPPAAEIVHPPLKHRDREVEHGHRPSSSP